MAAEANHQRTAAQCFEAAMVAEASHRQTARCFEAEAGAEANHRCGARHYRELNSLQND